MAFGDIGGVVTELIITCQTPATGAVAIQKGDAVCLAGNYTVASAAADDDPVFGQALAVATANQQALPVKVRGVCSFPYTGAAPAVNGAAGVTASVTPGKVKKPASGNGRGINLSIDTADAVVHVLL